MAAVPGVLLDQVHDDVAHLDRLAVVELDPRRSEVESAAVELLLGRGRPRAARSPTRRRPRRRPRPRRRSRGRGPRPCGRAGQLDRGPAPGGTSVCSTAAEVAHQPEQRHRRRRHRPRGPAARRPAPRTSARTSSGSGRGTPRRTAPLPVAGLTRSRGGRRSGSTHMSGDVRTRRGGRSADWSERDRARRTLCVTGV